MPILPANETNFDAEVPIIIVGAGACGLIAAMAATSDGGEVIVVEAEMAQRQNVSAYIRRLLEGTGNGAVPLEGVRDAPLLASEVGVPRGNGSSAGGDDAVASRSCQG